MHLTDLGIWQHTHAFGMDRPRTGERRTRWVVLLTAAMMIVEVVAGMMLGSLALLADGWHMGTHAAALGIALFAYIYARRRACDPRFSFGTGKVGALGGFGSAVVLAVVALLILGESLVRIGSPVTIHFDQAIAVALLGLAVNLASAFLLSGAETGHPHAHDHNLRGAYLHVMADALTSVLAIGALLAGKLLGWIWMDPVMGVVGSLVIARWSLGLLRDTSRVLLDGDWSGNLSRELRETLEATDDNRVADLHLWRIGTSQLAAIISIVTRHPRPPSYYKAMLGGWPELAHVTVEVQPCE